MRRLGLILAITLPRFFLLAWPVSYLLSAPVHSIAQQLTSPAETEFAPTSTVLTTPPAPELATAQPLGVSNVVTETPFSERNFRDDVLSLPVDHLFGDWFGARTQLEDSGVTPSVTFVSNLMGNPVGGLRQGFTEANNVGVNFLFDLEKRRGWEGASFLATFSQRSGNSLSNDYIGNTFSAQQVFGASTFHVVDLAYQQKAWDDNVEFRLGRLAAADDFFVSSYTYGFVQGGIIGTPAGIFKNDPGMTGYPNATWGGLLKLKMTSRSYVMGGLYNGDTSIRDLDNHGMDFSMQGPLFAIVEAGYRHNQLAGDTGLVGNYKIGMWYDANDFADLATQSYGAALPNLGIDAPVSEGNYGFCAIFDQVLVPFSSPHEEIYRGLGVVGSVVLSPDQSKSQMPYYFTTGVAARGIWAERPRDVAAFAFIFGEFSSDIRFGQRQAQLIDPSVGIQKREMALEWTYIFRFRDGAYFIQPDLQYILRPNGYEQIPDALVCGAQVGINF
jgi:porin